MSIITTFPFDNTANYTKVQTVVDSGVGKLALINNPSQNFSEDFNDDTDFTYDSAKAEFASGLLRQLSQRPSGALFHSNFTTKDGNWGDGTLTGTLVGNAVVSSGKLVLDTSNNSYIQYNGDNMPTGNKGCVRFTFTPNYSGSPASNNYLFASSAAESNIANMIRLMQIGVNIRIDIFNSAGVSVLTSQTGNTFNPVAGTDYEFEFNWDADAGTHRLFINGVLVGGTKSGTGTLGARTIIRQGKDYTASTNQSSNGDIDDLIIFDTPQHTANYTPGQAIPAFDYATSKVDGPSFAYTGLGNIIALNSGTVTEVGAPRFIFNSQYWNGSAWVSSDGTYAQSNDLATASANFATFVPGGNTITWSVIFPDTNTQSSVEDLNIVYTGQHYATEGTLLTNSSFIARDITAFQATETIPANTAIKYAIEVNGTNKYHNGSAWVDSDGTNAQANTLAEIQANIDNLISLNSTIKILIVLTSTSQQATPEIDLISVTYDFGALEPSPPTQCQVFGYLKDAENNPIVGATVSVVANRDDDQYKEAASRLISKTIEKTTDASGFFSFNLIISSDYEVTGAQAMQYVLSVAIQGQTLPIFKNGTADKILFEVPNQASVNITEQIQAA